MAACIDYPPYVILTIGLRNGPPPTFVVDLEFVTQVPGPVFAGILGLRRVVGSCQLLTSIFQRCLGGVMVTPMLAVLETTSGRRRRTQSGRGN